MITGWIMAFLLGTGIGMIGHRKRMSTPFCYACMFVVGVAISVVCQDVGLP